MSSVTLVECDHKGWNFSKIMSPLVSLGTPRNFGPQWPTRCWFERQRSQIAAEWLQIAQRSQWRAYRKPPSTFRMVPSLTNYDLPFPQVGVPYVPKIREWPYLRNRWSDKLYFGSRVGFSGSADRMALTEIYGYIKSKVAAGRHLG